jgi:hypothetical protein
VAVSGKVRNALKPERTNQKGKLKDLQMTNVFCISEKTLTGGHWVAGGKGICKGEGINEESEGEYG